MQLFESVPEPPIGPTAVTVGVFDGLHLGHRAMIAATRARALEHGARSLVLSFRDHPDLLLRGEAPLPLMTLEQRLDGLEALGVEVCLLLEFDEAMRQLGAAEFARDLLHGALDCRALLLGFDSAICRDREGTVERFAALGKELGFTSERVPPVYLGDRVISSSAIRRAIVSGRMELVREMLGRPWSLRGPVVGGERRGRAIGFPTANLVPQRLCLPPFGVYAVHAELHGRLHAAVANLGLRPTIGDLEGPLLEVHVLDYDGELYGRELRVHFHSRIREERRFSSLEALKARIHEDCAEARRRLLPAG